MDRHIDARTLSENLTEILDQAASGEERFIVEVNGRARVVIALDLGDAAGRPAKAFTRALDELHADVEARDLPPMTMDEIDEEIAACRREKRAAEARQ